MPWLPQRALSWPTCRIAQRSAQPEGSARLQLAPRLTHYQPQQKAAAREQFTQLQAAGNIVTFNCGWRLQRKDGSRWVDVPVA
jgi:hypothetical protein